MSVWASAGMLCTWDGGFFFLVCFLDLLATAGTSSWMVYTLLSLRARARQEKIDGVLSGPEALDAIDGGGVTIEMGPADGYSQRSHTLPSDSPRSRANAPGGFSPVGSDEPGGILRRPSSMGGLGVGLEPAGANAGAEGGVTPELFAQLWEQLGESGSFECQVERAPSLAELRTHLTVRSFTVMASGLVDDVLKLYFFGQSQDDGGGPPVLFLAEVVLQVRVLQLQATFKCDEPDSTPEFVQRLQLRDLFFA